MKPVTVLTWNIQQDQWNGPRGSLAERQFRKMNPGDDGPDIICLQGVSDPANICSWLPGYSVESNKKTLVAYRLDRFNLQRMVATSLDLTMVRLLELQNRAVIVAASALFCPDLLRLVIRNDVPTEKRTTVFNDDVCDCVTEIEEYENHSHLVVVGASCKPPTQVSSVFRAFRHLGYGYGRKKNSFFPPSCQKEEEVLTEGKRVRFATSVSASWTEERRVYDQVFAKAFFKEEGWLPTCFETRVCGSCGPNRPENRTSDHLAVVGQWGDDLSPLPSQWIDSLGDDCGTN